LKSLKRITVKRLAKKRSGFANPSSTVYVRLVVIENSRSMDKITLKSSYLLFHQFDLKYTVGALKQIL